MNNNDQTTAGDIGYQEQVLHNLEGCRYLQIETWEIYQAKKLLLIAPELVTFVKPNTDEGTFIVGLMNNTTLFGTYQDLATKLQTGQAAAEKWDREQAAKQEKVVPFIDTEASIFDTMKPKG